MIGKELSSATKCSVMSTRTIEIREPSEVNEAIAAELAANGSGPGSAAASIMSAKPARPGRGKARVAKFKADEDV